MVYLIVSGLGAPTRVFLVVVGAINWAAVFGFIQLVSRVTISSTRKAQAPAIRAQRRAAATPALPLRDAVPQLARPQSATTSSGKE
jgi:NADH-quinone oxidoreductase subunit H